MQVGLLWFDNDPRRGLDAKVEDAARRYREKFGASPNACYVNPAALDAQPSASQTQLFPAPLRVIPATNILPHHFWIGVEEG